MNPLKYLRRYKKNGTMPALMGGSAGILAILILGVFSLSILDSYLLRSPSLASVISAVLVDLANGDRSAKSLGRLAWSPALTAAAQAKASDMAAKGYFAHVSPEGKNSWYWFSQAEYTFLYAGENLAVDFSDSLNVEQAWMNSPTHRANILDGHFTEVGIATAQGVYEGNPTTFVVQMFGTPAPRNTMTNIQTASSLAEATTTALATGSIDSSQATKPAPAVAVATATKPVAVAVAPTQVLGTQADSILPAPASWWQHLLASPKSTLQYAYYALALITLILLAFVTELEFHRRHMRHVAAAACLFILMAGLFTFANTVFFATPTLAAL
jgi:Cysteine-rich secretory protein family